MNKVPFISYSNYGEDAALSGILSRLSHINDLDFFNSQTYIDIGCYDPVIANNTYFLYKSGWRGTLVEPNPYLHKKIEDQRPEDYLHKGAISSKIEEKYFYILSEDHQCNTISELFLNEITKYRDISLKETILVKTETLDSIINIHKKIFNQLPAIINIDVEGIDFEVLQSFSFLDRPMFFMVEDEILGCFNNSKTYNLMIKNNYFPVYSNFLTTLYMDKKNKFFDTIYMLGKR